MMTFTRSPVLFEILFVRASMTSTVSLLDARVSGHGPVLAVEEGYIAPLPLLALRVRRIDRDPHAVSLYGS